MIGVSDGDVAYKTAYFSSPIVDQRIGGDFDPAFVVDNLDVARARNVTKVFSRQVNSVGVDRKRPRVDVRRAGKYSVLIAGGECRGELVPLEFEDITCR